MPGKMIMHPTIIPMIVQFKGKMIAIIDRKPGGGADIKIYVDEYLRYSIEVEEVRNGKTG